MATSGSPSPFASVDEPRVDLLLDRQSGVLDLDVGGLAAEDVHEPGDLGLGLLLVPLLERLADAAGEATRERDQPPGVALQELPVDPRLVVVALEVAGRDEPDQVRVALVRLGEQREVRVPLRLRLAVVTDVDLAADDGLHAGPLAMPVELDGARQRAVIGQPDRGHLELCRPGDQIGDPAGAVEDRVLRVHVQVDEGGAHRTGDCSAGSLAGRRCQRRCSVRSALRCGNRPAPRASPVTAEPAAGSLRDRPAPGPPRHG